MTTALPHYDLRDPAPLTMSREELTAIQDERLGTMVAYVYETSPFWRRKLDGAGVRPGDVAGVEDLPRLPFCTRAELDADQAEHPPFGGYACSPRETWMGLFTTSGTSGRKLKRVVSERDWRLMIDRFYRHPAPPAGEIFMLLGPIDGLLGPAVGVEAARERGQIPLLAGLWDTRIKVEAIAELRPGTIAGAASYIVHLADVAREMGVDLAACGVRTVTSFGEPGVAIGATHATISSRYGVSELIDGYGLTEVWPLGGNCPASGALHIADDIAAVECVDPDTGVQLPEGETGEIVHPAAGGAFAGVPDRARHGPAGAPGRDDPGRGARPKWRRRPRAPRPRADGVARGPWRQPRGRGSGRGVAAARPAVQGQAGARPQDGIRPDTTTRFPTVRGAP